jgi:ABC-type lipoprotein export system ATPase subunit
MLTRLRLKNFKKLDEVNIELGKSVVFIGPNNSGKTTALQALALWDIGLRQWNAKRSGKKSPEKRAGVAVNRRDLIAIPTPVANLLWNDLHVRNVNRVDGRTRTQNVLIEIVVEGVTGGKSWECGLEFDYANEESFYCRPLRLTSERQTERMRIPEESTAIRVAFLPPMSGLAGQEPKWEPGRINVLLGEGQTAQVLRNICYQIHESNESDWRALSDQIDKLFGVILLPPQYIRERGEITMSYREHGTQLDLSSSGRGLQQTLLLLAHLYANPNSVLLLDEPDAHLEILRQRQIYQLLTGVAASKGSQIIAASHSEVVLNEAADRDIVIAFLGKPHRIDDRGSHVLKALKEIGFEQYYQAEQTGWVLYLEGSTDLAILQTLAKTLGHSATKYLEQPFVHYVANQPQKARDHFYGLREAIPNLAGIAIFDRLEKGLQKDHELHEVMWLRRELENYLCQEDVLLAYARHQLSDDLFGQAEAANRERIMKDCINEIATALEALRKPNPWSHDIKASDEFLDPLFDRYFEKLSLPNLLRKTDYHVLAEYLPKDSIDRDIIAKLDAIARVAESAKRS